MSDTSRVEKALAAAAREQGGTSRSVKAVARAKRENPERLAPPDVSEPTYDEEFGRHGMGQAPGEPFEWSSENFQDEHYGP